MHSFSTTNINLPFCIKSNVFAFIGLTKPKQQTQSFTTLVKLFFQDTQKSLKGECRKRKL